LLEVVLGFESEAKSYDLYFAILTGSSVPYFESGLCSSSVNAS